MKKRLVYFLCRIGCRKLAYKISPKYTIVYYFYKGLQDGAARLTERHIFLSKQFNIKNNPKKDGFNADHTYIDESEVDTE